MLEKNIYLCSLCYYEEIIKYQGFCLEISSALLFHRKLEIKSDKFDFRFVIAKFDMVFHIFIIIFREVKKKLGGTTYFGLPWWLRW